MLEQKAVHPSCKQYYPQPMVLQASTFFQDHYMVKKLSSMLGRRLFRAHPEGADTSSAAQQPVTMQDTAQVCTQLSAWQIMSLQHEALYC